MHIPIINKFCSVELIKIYVNTSPELTNVDLLRTKGLFPVISLSALKKKLNSIKENILI